MIHAHRNGHICWPATAVNTNLMLSSKDTYFASPHWWRLFEMAVTGRWSRRLVSITIKSDISDFKKTPQIPVDMNKNRIRQTSPPSNYFSCQSFPRILALRGDKLFVQSNRCFSLIKRQILFSCSDNTAYQWATVPKTKYGSLADLRSSVT